MMHFQSEPSGGREIALLLKANKLLFPEGQDGACKVCSSSVDWENAGNKTGFCLL